jgi:uncharacterized protein YbaR (Trm112 family)
MAISTLHIIACPNCHKIHQKHVIIGGFPSYTWSDLLVVGRGGNPYGNLKINACPHCNHFFWVHSEYTLGVLKYDSPLEWKEAPEADEQFDFNFWKHLVEIQFFENEEEECYVRLHTWQTYNHFFRNEQGISGAFYGFFHNDSNYQPNDTLIEFNKQNISRLYQILPSKSEENWLLKAEIQRHLENWEECVKICRKAEKNLKDGHYLRVAFRKMRKLAQEQHSKVVQIFS